MYTYRDFATGKIKRTRGKFVGWSEPQGPLIAPYAEFQNRRSFVLVPYYCLTEETKRQLPPMPQRGQ